VGKILMKSFAIEFGIIQVYQIVTLPDAEDDLIQLQPSIAKRIVKRIYWLADNAEVITPRPLKGELKDYLNSGKAIIGSSMKLFNENI